MEVPKDQIATLMEHGLYNSAQMLGCFLVSSPAANAEINPHLKAESLVLVGDSLYREGEFRRAIGNRFFKAVPSSHAYIQGTPKNNF